MRAASRAAVLVAAGAFLAQTGCSGSGADCVPSVEACDGQDNDCDGVVDEGCACVDGVSQPCYTGPASTRGVGTCHDGEQACVDGRWGECVGEVLPALDACDGEGLDEDCDGAVDNGLVPDWNPGCSATTMHSEFSGDTAGNEVVLAGTDERWVTVRITEDSLDLGYLSGRLVLNSRPGVDYDLYVYCYSCSLDYPAGSSTKHTFAGHDDVVFVRTNDLPLLDDGFTVVLEIRFHASEACAPWILRMRGNVVVGAETC